MSKMPEATSRVSLVVLELPEVSSCGFLVALELPDFPSITLVVLELTLVELLLEDHELFLGCKENNKEPPKREATTLCKWAYFVSKPSLTLEPKRLLPWEIYSPFQKS